MSLEFGHFGLKSRYFLLVLLFDGQHLFLGINLYATRNGWNWYNWVMFGVWLLRVWGFAVCFSVSVDCDATTKGNVTCSGVSNRFSSSSFLVMLSFSTSNSYSASPFSSLHNAPTISVTICQRLILSKWKAQLVKWRKRISSDEISALVVQATLFTIACGLIKGSWKYLPIEWALIPVNGIGWNQKQVLQNTSERLIGRCSKQLVGQHLYNRLWIAWVVG